MYNHNAYACNEYNPHIVNDLNVDKISFNEVCEKLNKLDISKSPGPDGIHPRVLFELRDLLSPIFYLIFNLSLKFAYLPNDWRESVVSVLFKKGARDLVSNYRPISLTCISCKLMDRVNIKR